jgi:hypothetical protein
VRGGAGNVTGRFIVAVWQQLSRTTSSGSFGNGGGGGGKYPVVDPSGEVLGRDSRRGVNAALWDGTGRPATRWWQAAGHGGGVGWR